MTLTDEQKQAVQLWISEGADLGEIQNRLRADYQITMTYLEARLLMDDLKVAPKDPEVSEEPKIEEADDLTDVLAEDAPPLPPGGAGKVSLSVDQIVRPGAMISGKATFSDGQKAEWYIDSTGRLGLNPDTPGYRPSEQDVMAFQMELQQMARSQGL